MPKRRDKDEKAPWVPRQMVFGRDRRCLAPVANVGYRQRAEERWRV